MTTLQKPTANRVLLSVKEAEEATGLSRWTWRKWAYSGKVESTRISNRLRIPIAEIERVIAEGTRQRVAHAQ